MHETTPCYHPLEVNLQNDHGDRDALLLDAHAYQVADFPLSKMDQIASSLQFFERGGYHHWIIGCANHVNNGLHFQEFFPLFGRFQRSGSASKLVLGSPFK